MTKYETVQQFTDRISPEIALKCFNIVTISNNIVEITQYRYYKTWSGLNTRPSNVFRYKIKLNANNEIIESQKL